MANSVPVTISLGAVVRFGVFEADLRSGELHKCGVKVKIQELPFQALKLLVSRPNEVVSREDLRQVMWADGVYVEFDRGVISAINRLRDALGDSAENPVFIETVGRRGYRWIAPTHFSEPTHEAMDVAVPESRLAPQKAGANLGHQRVKLWRILAVAILICISAIFWARQEFSSRSTKVLMSATGSAVTPRHAPANREA